MRTDTVGDPSEWAGALALLHDGDLLRLVLPNQCDPRHRGHGVRRLPGRGPQTVGGTQTAETSIFVPSSMYDYGYIAFWATDVDILPSF